MTVLHDATKGNYLLESLDKPKGLSYYPGYGG